MMFKILSFLTLALALSSLDVVTAILVPKDGDSGQLNRRHGANAGVGAVTINVYKPSPGKWVFCYLMCTAMLKSSSNPIICLIGVRAIGTSTLPSSWVVFIFSRWAPITENFTFSGCFLTSACMLRLRMVMNVVDLLRLLLLGICQWNPMQQLNHRHFYRSYYCQWSPGVNIRCQGWRCGELKTCASGVAWVAHWYQCFECEMNGWGIKVTKNVKDELIRKNQTGGFDEVPVIDDPSTSYPNSTSSPNATSSSDSTFLGTWFFEN